MAAGVSYAQTQPVVCPACGRRFDLAIWLIVDTAERPDLLARIREGTIHVVVCSHCGAELGHADAPLLVYTPAPPAEQGRGGGPPSPLVGEGRGGGESQGGGLLFSPAQGTTAAQDREQFVGLVNMLRTRLGDEWRDDWPPQGVTVVPRLLLPAVPADAAVEAHGRAPQPAGAEVAGPTPEPAPTGRPDPQAAMSSGAEASDMPGEADREFARLLRLQEQAETAPQLWPAVVAGWEAFLRRPDTAGAPLRQANARGNLGNACLRLYGATGEEEWVERAQTVFGQALAVFTRPEHPAEWANVQHSLGTLYYRRYERSGAEAHAEAAERHFRAALDEYRREAAPAQWAMTQHNLGNLHTRRYKRSGAEAHAEAAERHYRAALEVRRRKAAPADWAMTQHNLGNLYLSRYERSGAEAHAEAAERHYRAALEVRRRKAAPADWAMTQHNLGNLYLSRYERSGADAYAEAAERRFRAALEEYRREAAPAQWATVQHSLGNLYARRYERSKLSGHLEEAVDHWQDALASLHDVMRASIDIWGPVGQAAALTRRLVAAHLTLGRPAAALAAAEAGRGVRLRLDLARSGRVPAGLTDAEADEYRQLVEEVRAVASLRRSLDREGLPPAEHAARLAELGRRHAAATARLNALEARDPAFGRTLDAAAIAALARQHGLTLVFLVPTDEPERGTVAFIVPLRGGGREGEKEEGGEPEVLELPGLTRQDLYNLLFALPEGMVWGASAWPYPPAVFALADREKRVGWLYAYWLTRLARYRDDALNRPNDWEPLARDLWHATMTRVLDELGRRLMAPLAARLQALGARRVVIVPGDHLGLLPLHAAPSPTPDPLPLPARPVAQPDRLPHLAGEGTLFADLFEVAYAPSAAALAQCLERAAAVGAQRRCAPTLVYAPTLVAVANPDGSLAFADDEVAAIARLFAGRARVAYGPAARRAWLLEHAPTADYLELSTHGRFAPGAPERSTLLLAHPEGYIWPLWRADVRERQPLAALQEGCERLTLDDVWAGRLPLPEGGVVTLDACETAQVEPGDEADESLGFPAAFLAAGARAVIASLWAVDDFATSLLMEETYRRMLAGERPAPALRAAGQWLRSLPKAEVLRRLDAVIAPLEAEKQAGAWNALPRVERGQRLYRLAALENRRDSLKDEPDPPFAHPVWWAAFAAYGA